MKTIAFIIALLCISINFLQAQDTIEVRSGWNMIGAISTQSLDHISSEPPGIISSSFFGYSHQGYSSEDTIQKGNGYWVKTTQAGLLFLESTPVEEIEHPPATMVTLLVRDSSGLSFIDSCTIRDTSRSHIKIPLVGNLDLKSGNSYRCTFLLYDDAAPDSIFSLNYDLISERNAHIFKFLYSGLDDSRVNISNIDTDENNLPFGLYFTLSTTPGDTTNGNLHITLEHHDDGDKVGSVFDVDLDCDLPITITP